jgi:phospholipase/lecithinase/hemolysin
MQGRNDVSLIQGVASSRLTPIKYSVFMGDSLSDRAQINQSPFMSWLMGLSGSSPLGRFTDGYVWIDYFCVSLLLGMPPQLITHDIIKKFSARLSDPSRVASQHARDFVRSYCIGGLTAYDWSSRQTADVGLALTTEFVSNLSQQRQRLLQEDETTATSNEQKKLSLVFELSGANDLLTVNREPSEDIAHKVVDARIKNIELMIKQGYSNFVLIGLPDLSLTPRYQHRGQRERDRLKNIIQTLNAQLEMRARELQSRHPAIKIIFFDTNPYFLSVYNHPEKYGFDNSRIAQPYKQFSTLGAQAAKAGSTFMFWDDVHPSDAMHRCLSGFFYAKLKEHFHFMLPRESVIENFRDEYGKRWLDDKNACFGFFRRSRIQHLNSDLVGILRHGLYNKGYRTRDVLRTLGWINHQNKVISNNPHIQEAAQQLEAERKEIENESIFSWRYWFG